MSFVNWKIDHDSLRKVRILLARNNSLSYISEEIPFSKKRGVSDFQVLYSRVFERVFTEKIVKVKSREAP